MYVYFHCTKLKKNIQFVHTAGMRLSLISHHELKLFIHTGLKNGIRQ